MNKNIKKLVETLLNYGMFDSDVFDDDDDIEILDELNVSHNVGQPIYIDLGLPSGTLWADRNLGSYKPEEPGLYYLWGDTKGYTLNEKDFRFNIKNYKFYKDRNFMKYCTSIRKGLKDNKKILDLEDDAAYVNSDGLSCIPCSTNVTELLNNCDVNIDEINNKTILKCTSKINGNIIIFPLCGLITDYKYKGVLYTGLQDNNIGGIYLTCNLDKDKLYAPENAEDLSISARGDASVLSVKREYGCQIRPVILKDIKRRK